MMTMMMSSGIEVSQFIVGFLTDGLAKHQISAGS